jgi:4-amino-4-deoxy-L-arabinose transferase-like glycosyltransferase
MNNVFFKKPQLSIFLILLIAASLRFPWLDRFPPALYSDEVSQGYNAYSILTTARDEYGNFLPISFRSFGDWKPPVPTYLMVPFIALFGLTPLAVRFPSALLGTLTVGITYLLVRRLCKQLKSDPDFSIRLGLISAFLLAISPWHISQSRSAMLIGVELFFFASAVWLFLKGLSKPNWWYISSLCFVMAIYSYYGMRVIVPLFILFLLYYWRAEIRQNITAALAGFGIGIICLLPLIGAFITNPDVVFGRAKTVSVFYDQGVALTVWDQIAQDGAKYSPMLTQILHNKPYSYFVDIQRRFMQHFDMRFLFLVGDTQLPFQIPGMGVLYFIDGILLLLGVRNIIRKSPRAWWFLVAWAVVSIIPAALTFITPAANRTFTLVIPLMIVMAYGIVSLF